jgi:hypothetical protein
MLKPEVRRAETTSSQTGNRVEEIERIRGLAGDAEAERFFPPATIAAAAGGVQCSLPDHRYKQENRKRTTETGTTLEKEMPWRAGHSLRSYLN